MNKSLISVILFSFFAGACRHQKPAAIGGDEQIIVFSDSSEWAYSEALLRGVFERVVRTPQPEAEFTLQYEPVSVFNTYQRYKSLILLGTLDSKREFSQTIQHLLSADAETAVRSGGYFYFVKNNEWAEGQTVMILVSENSHKLNQCLRDRRDELFQVFDDRKTELLSNSVYGSVPPDENENHGNDLFQKFGWRLRMLPEYRIVDERPNYVRFHTGVYSSQRWISVYWTACRSQREADSLINRKWMIETRNQLGRWFSDPVAADSGYGSFQDAGFGGYRALRYDGIWKTLSFENAFGGPFRSYAFYESVTRRVYFLDACVFSPEENKKLKLLRQLDIILKSFSTQNPL